MATPVSTTVTELPESRVRVQAEVPAAEVEKRVAVAARALGRNLRIPGFRKGKVPPPVIIQRVGREAVLDEAVRESIAGWYSAAIDAANVVPVGEPDLDLDGPARPRASRCASRSRSASARPPRSASTPGSRSAAASPRSPTRRSTARSSSCATAWPSSRPSSAPPQTGDFVVMDFLGTLDGEPFGGGEGRDQMVELGSGRLVPGFEDQLDRRLRRRGARRSRSSSPTTTARPTSPASRPSSRSRSRRSRPRSCPSSTTTSPPRPASTRSTSCARTSASASPRRRSARSRASSARPRSTPPSPPRPSRCPSR